MPAAPESGRELVGLPAHPATDSEHGRGSIGIGQSASSSAAPAPMNPAIVTPDWYSLRSYRGTRSPAAVRHLRCGGARNDGGRGSTWRPRRRCPRTYVAGWIKRGPTVSSAPTSPAPCRRWRRWWTISTPDCSPTWPGARGAAPSRCGPVGRNGRCRRAGEPSTPPRSPADSPPAGPGVKVHRGR